ncbi:hypothetical protein AYI69_g8535 [Smittium culicis]|uniref:Uncharacterized protein n=1 Tax=Smittium culicis TaxID=133412 RepID=A0A1R1X160_9FUNG|nr:hypothetical protein AYI69_g11115 [Smittium culicis]OMJ14590.1 hypothetical protein AYI69_g8535 [Smittium culicis]
MIFKFPTQEETNLKIADAEALYLNKYILIDDDDDSSMNAQHLRVQPAASVDPESIIKNSQIPHPKRLIYPNTPVTRDLRPNRLNLHIDNSAKIFKIGFF